MKKKLSLIIVLMFLFLYGCQRNIDVSDQYLSGSNKTTGDISTNIPNNVFLSGVVGFSTIISGIKCQIIISGNELIYCEEMKINIPKDLEKWEYEYRYKEKVSFDSDKNKKQLSIYSNIIDEENFSIDITCRNTDRFADVTQPEINTKSIGGNLMYITSVMYDKNRTTEICFQNKKMFYNIKLINYVEQTENEIINSIVFLK